MATGRSDLTVVCVREGCPAGGGAAVANGLPSIISGRGYYTYLTFSAMTYRNGVMAKNWVYDSVTEITNGGGDHSEMAADVTGTVRRRSSLAQGSSMAMELSGATREWATAMPWT